MLRTALDQAKMSHILVESAGIDNEDRTGEPPEAENAAYALKYRGISLEGHESRFIGNLNPTESDLVILVEHMHKYVVEPAYPGIRAILVRNEKGVESPYIHTSGFDGMMRDIDEAVKEIVALLQGNCTPT